MAKLGELVLEGASGASYTFSVYPWGTNFKAIAGVYYVSKREAKSDGGGTHTKIYVGQTEDLSERFDNHHRADCFRRHGANCISVHLDDDEDSRLAKESDLINALDPPCNG